MIFHSFILWFNLAFHCIVLLHNLVFFNVATRSIFIEGFNGLCCVMTISVGDVHSHLMNLVEDLSTINHIHVLEDAL